MKPEITSEEFEAQFLETRARILKLVAAYLRGETDVHPQGKMGADWIIPHVCSTNMWDTHPRGWKSSAWGNAAGIV